MSRCCGPFAIAALSLPSLLAYNVSPSSTFLNQALSASLWGAFVLALGRARLRGPASFGSGSGYAMAVTAVLAGAIYLWGELRGLPDSLALSLTSSVAAAATVAVAGRRAGRGSAAASLFALTCAGALTAGLLGSLIAFVQVFLPGWADGTWIAVSGTPGRAVGNLRQPNHLSTVLLWACVAAVALHELGRLRRGLAAAALSLCVLAVVWTASRTGLLSVALLAGWGLLDRRLSLPGRVMLLASPLVYFAGWLGMAAWARFGGFAFFGTARLAETDISGSRFGIWRNTLALILEHPWTGVGLGNFNFAWTLTPFPVRPPAFFDHAHNLPLHLAAELGLPLAALIVGLLLAGLWRIARAIPRADGERGVSVRAALVFLLMVGLHSLLEYPLWYAYFLLPTAFVFGFALALAQNPPVDPAGVSSARRMRSRRRLRRSWPLTLAGAAMAVGAVAAVVDYGRVAAIFDASAPGTLADRIATGQRSVLFAHHADYAAVTMQRDPPAPPEAFARTTHFLLDTRLMMAWADSLAWYGRVDQARYLAARLREFRNPASQAFFAECPERALPAAEAQAQGLSYRCALPERVWTWKDFRS